MLALKYSGKVQFFFTKFYKRVRTGKHKALYRVSGLIMSACKRTIRISQRASSPGQPVHSRTRGGIRTIRFAVFGDSSVIGPLKFAGSNFFDEPVPHIHEFGGTFVSHYYYSQYPARPYMSVTLDRLNRQGVLPRQFSITMARII